MTSTSSFEILPDGGLSPFVKCFWITANNTETDLALITLPDGCMELIIAYQDKIVEWISLSGIMAEARNLIMPSGQLKIGIRLKPLAAEYYLDTYLKAGNEVINRFAEFAKPLSGELAADLKSFAARASDDMNQVLKTRTLDERKLKLFGLLEETSGAIPVETLAQQCYWSTRQINRYFNKQLGISLKGYCNILRCYASYGKIKAGHLYPDFDYYDQSHFIREIKKHTGTTPKALLKNEYQRYLQFNDRNSLR